MLNPVISFGLTEAQNSESLRYCLRYLSRRATQAGRTPSRCIAEVKITTTDGSGTHTQGTHGPDLWKEEYDLTGYVFNVYYILI